VLTEGTTAAGEQIAEVPKVRNEPEGKIASPTAPGVLTRGTAGKQSDERTVADAVSFLFVALLGFVSVSIVIPLWERTGKWWAKFQKNIGLFFAGLKERTGKWWAKFQKNIGLFFAGLKKNAIDSWQTRKNAVTSAGDTTTEPKSPAPTTSGPKVASPVSATLGPASKTVDSSNEDSVDSSMESTASSSPAATATESEDSSSPPPTGGKGNASAGGDEALNGGGGAGDAKKPNED